MKNIKIISAAILLLVAILMAGTAQADVVKKGKTYPYSGATTINGALYDGSTEKRVYHFWANVKYGPVEIFVTTSSGFVADTQQIVTAKYIYRPNTRLRVVGKPRMTWAKRVGKKTSAHGITVDFRYTTPGPVRDGNFQEVLVKRRLSFLRPNRARTLKFSVQPVCYDLSILAPSDVSGVFPWYPKSPTPDQLAGWQCMPLKFTLQMVVDKIGRRSTGGLFDRDVEMDSARIWPGPLGFADPYPGSTIPTAPTSSTGPTGPTG